MACHNQVQKQQKQKEIKKIHKNSEVKINFKDSGSPGGD
jgi:hypothetical protein